MREIKTIEVDKWVPSEKKGMVKHDGMVSPQEAWEALKKHLEGVGLMPDEYFLPGRWVYDDKVQLPDYFRASCDVNWGGSEGIYLDIALLYWDENKQLQRFDFATGKTLSRSGDDFFHMSRIAAECSLMLNGRGDLVKVSEHHYDNIKTVEQDKQPLSSQIQTAKELSDERINKNVADKFIGQDISKAITEI